MMDSFKSLATIDSLQPARAYVLHCAAEAGYSGSSTMALELVVEEVLVNVASYAYPTCAGEIEIICSSDEKLFTISFSDSGVPFDPLERSAPDTEASIDERRIGGLGIHLIRKMSRAVEYKRENGRNIFRVSFDLNPGGDECA